MSHIYSLKSRSYTSHQIIHLIIYLIILYVYEILTVFSNSIYFMAINYIIETFKNMSVFMKCHQKYEYLLKIRVLVDLKGVTLKNLKTFSIHQF